MNQVEHELAGNPLRTREELRRALDTLCGPLKPLYSPGGARLRLRGAEAKYDTRTQELESFARPLWGLVPLAAGEGELGDFRRLYRQGLINGTNPDHPEFWGWTGDTDQRYVEMAAIGLGLALAPEWLWQPLSPEEQSRLALWLDQINHYALPRNNWRFFIVLVNLGLKKAGGPYNAAAMEAELVLLERFYLSDGWYADGATEQRDYYVSFAMHYYSLIYAALMEKEDPERAARFRERARLFAADFIHWFAGDGSALPYGRSLTYRFAQSAFWGAAAYAGVECISWGTMKGVLLRNLRWWLKQPVLQGDGTLSVGYAYPNAHMAEEYNAPGSPYWAFKAFLPLALPEDHPFWTAEEEPLPILAPECEQPHARLILRRENNHIAVFTGGQYALFEPVHTAAKYSKFVYSNVFGFSVSRGSLGLSQGGFDSMLAFSEGDDIYRGRRTCEEFRVENGIHYSRWRLWEDVEVQTWLLPGLPWHVRIHRVETGRLLHSAEGGFAVDLDGLPKREASLPDCGQPGIYLCSGQGISGIFDLFGHRRTQEVELAAGANLLYPRALLPMLIDRLDPGVHWLASAVAGSPGKDYTLTALTAAMPSLTWETGLLTVTEHPGSAVGRILRIHTDREMRRP